MGNSGKDKRRRLKRKMTKAKATKLELELLRLSKAAKPLFRSSASHAEKCKALGLEPDDPRPLYEPIYARIEETLSAASVESGVSIRKLERHLWLRHLCDELPFRELLEQLFPIRDATLQKTGILPSLDDVARWAVAFNLAQTFRESEGTSFFHQSVPGELWILAQTVKRLRSCGYAITIIDGDPDLQACLPQIARDLDELVADYGGLNLAESLFQQHQSLFKPLFGRYVIAPSTAIIPRGNERPLVPSGYLLNLAAKHADKLGRPSQQTLDRLIQLSTDFAATYECQPYSAAHGIWNAHKTILKYLRETAAFDSLFTFPQSDRRTLKRRMLGILAPLDSAGYIALDFGVTLELLTSIVDTAVRDAPWGPSIVSPFEIAQKLDLDTGVVTSVLNRLARDSVNQEFLNPLDVHHCQLHSVPFLRASGGYLILDPTLASASMLEAVLSVCRTDAARHADKLAGEQGLEGYVRGQLKAKGCAIAWGKYSSPSVGNPECDCAVETQETILLFELKKKPLTQKARSADPLPLLIDLGRSLLHAQCQAARHEVALYRDDAIVMGDDTVHRNGRRVQRIALTFNHFGSFHCRDLTMQFLRLMTGVKLTTDAVVENRELARGVRDFDEYCSNLQRWLLQAGEAGVPEPSAYFNCWFLSLDIFDILLDESTNGESFWMALKSTMFISSGSRDWFREYAMMKRALSEAAAQKANSSAPADPAHHDPRELVTASPSA